MSMNQDPINLRLTQWFMRETSDYAARKVAQLPVAISSDVGIVRTENQDRVGVLRAQITLNRSFLVAVLCDGMGGMVEGAECASLTIAAFLTSCIRNRYLPPIERLKMSVDSANISVYSKYSEKGGSTLSAFLLDSEGNFVAINVGDSRIYYFSDNRLIQLSEDDTLAGQFKNNEKQNHMSGELLQYIGMGNDLEPHLISMPKLDSKSQLIMTSDGVHFLNKETMQSIIQNSGEPKLAARRLVDLARWCGGKDNASIVVASNLTSMLAANSEEGYVSGAVEIWDAYGDVQLIGIEKTGVPISSYAENDKHANASLFGDEIGKSNLDREKDSTEEKGKKRLRKKGKVKNKKNIGDDGDLDEKPQVRIDFE